MVQPAGACDILLPDIGRAGVGTDLTALPEVVLGSHEVVLGVDFFVKKYTCRNPLQILVGRTRFAMLGSSLANIG
jgi:hypothetical protein